MTVRRGCEPAKSERSEFVSGNYFSTFGIGPFAGRMLTPPDDTQERLRPRCSATRRGSRSSVATLSCSARHIYLQRKPVTVVGVAPPGFFGDRITDSPPAIWIPLAMEPLIHGKNANSECYGQQLAIRGRAAQTWD